MTFELVRDLGWLATLVVFAWALLRTSPAKPVTVRELCLAVGIVVLVVTLATNWK